jgi:hypothetical protein
VLATLLILFRMAGDSPVSDEPVHIASGVETLARGTWTWNPEHPPLAKAGAALGLLGLGLRPPEGPFDPARRRANLLAFLNENTAPQETIVFRARLFSVALFFAPAVGVRREARARFGLLAGCAALALAAFEPTLQCARRPRPHRTAVACFLVLSLGPLRRVLEGEAAPRATVLLGVLWGLMFLSKYSAPLLAFASLGLFFAVAKRAPLARLAPRVLAAAVLALAVALLGFSLAGRHQSREHREALAHELCAVKALEAAERRAPNGAVLPAAGNPPERGRERRAAEPRGRRRELPPRTRLARGLPGYFPRSRREDLAGAPRPSSRVRARLPAADSPRPSSRASSWCSPLPRARATTSASVTCFRVAASPWSRALRSRLATEAPRVAWWPLGIQAPRVRQHRAAPAQPFQRPHGRTRNGCTLLVDSNLDWGQDSRGSPRSPRDLEGTAAGPRLGGDPWTAIPRSGSSGRPMSRRLDSLAMGETPLAIGPEFYAARGNQAEARAFEAVRRTLRERGERVGSVGYSIGPGASGELRERGGKRRPVGEAHEPGTLP